MNLPLTLPKLAAGRVALRPLSPSELRRAFLEAGGVRNAVRSPDGRSVSSALAGIKGFALGVTNGVGGALLYDVATSTTTLAYVTNLLNNLNLGNLATNLGGSSNSNGGGTNNTVGTIQEVCFNSGSLVAESTRNNEEETADDQDDDEDFYDDEQEGRRGRWERRKLPKVARTTLLFTMDSPVLWSTLAKQLFDIVVVLKLSRIRVVLQHYSLSNTPQIKPLVY